MDSANRHAYKVCALRELTPYAQNPRTHSDAQVQQIRRSIQEFGFTNPLLIDEHGGIIAGHGRYLAAAAEGLAEVPCIAVTGLTEAQRKKLVIADNQLAINAAWDDELLRAELQAIIELGDAELSVVGFNEAELARLTGEAAAAAEDEWRGMPEFKQPDATAWRTIAVHFKDAGALELFAQTLKVRIPAEAAYLWFPEVARISTIDQRYVGE